MPNTPDSSGGFQIPAGLPLSGSSRLATTPLEAITGSFRDGLDWLKSEPADDSSPEEMKSVAEAFEAARSRRFPQAIDLLRKAKATQDARRKKGVVRRALLLVRPRRTATVVERFLAQVLTAHSVENANSALENFDRCQREMAGEDIIDVLKKRASSRPKRLSPLGGTDPAELLNFDDFRRQWDPDVQRLFRGKEHLLAGWLRQQGRLPSMGSCEICDGPAVGELKKADGRTWKICQTCAKDADLLMAHHRRMVTQLVQALEQSKKNLEEALALDPSFGVARTNLETCNQLLQQTAPARE